MKKLPKFLEKYFWDIDFDEIDVNKYKIYILRRILNYGDQKAVDWMWKNFTKSEIKEILFKYRGLSKKSANYWSLILDIPKEDVLCLKKHSLKGQKTAWPY